MPKTIGGVLNGNSEALHRLSALALEAAADDEVVELLHMVTCLAEVVVPTCDEAVVDVGGQRVDNLVNHVKALHAGQLVVADREVIHVATTQEAPLHVGVCGRERGIGRSHRNGLWGGASVLISGRFVGFNF